MPKQSIKVESPLKGVNRIASREQQPPSSVYDSLNVLPFDRTGRFRIGQRPGDATLIDTGTGLNVLSLYQVTLGQVSTSDGVSWTELFPYADGPLTGNNGWVDDSFSGLPHWTVASNILIPVTSGGHFSSNNNTADVVAFVATADWVYNYSFTPDSTINPSPATRSTAIFIGDPAADSFTATYTESAPGVGDIVVDYPGGNHTFAGVNLSQNGLHAVALQYIAATKALTLFVDDSPVSPVITLGADPVINDPLVQLTGAGVSVHDISLQNTAGGTIVQPRKTRLIATSNHSIFVGTTSGVTDIADDILTNSKPSITDFNGHAYIVDGTSTIDVDVAAATAAAMIASEGDVPDGCRIARSWRGRLILAGADSDPQNFFCSAAGDPTNWDFSVGDPGDAFSGNASTAGRVGDVLLDVIPFTNDVCLLMGDHSVWAITGDPTDGGSIDSISLAIGILGRDAWTIAPDGTLYFMGTGGLYKMQPGSTAILPVSLTAYPQFFTGIDRSAFYFQMGYDRDRFGLFAFVTHIGTGVSTHFWHDTRTDSMWPLQYPDSHGPMSALVYDGDGPADRTLLLGGRDGIIRQISDHNRNDDGTEIDSYAVLGPFNPTEGLASVLTATTIDFGELAPADTENPERWGVTVTLNGGPDAYSVTEGTPHTTATIDCPLERRQKIMRQRIRGGWFTVKLANSADNNYWAFETAQMEFEPAGRLRERR